jgi:hypothetical protein
VVVVYVEAGTAGRALLGSRIAGRGVYLLVGSGLNNMILSETVVTKTRNRKNDNNNGLYTHSTHYSSTHQPN